MNFVHRILKGLLEKQLPEILEKEGKEEAVKVIADIKASHTPEEYAHALKSFYNGAILFEAAIRKSPNKLDDAGLDIFLDPIREAAAADGITL
jgi:hypothetical protein